MSDRNHCISPAAAATRIVACAVAAVLAIGVGADPATAQDWQLVWSDEFEVDGLVDESKWSYQVGGSGWGNQELQYYTERRTENVRVEDGNLVIEARNEPFGGREYTSGRLRTLDKGDWLYGRIEVRAQLPPGLGTWPAIWMLASDSNYGNGGWPDTGEIDIMEAVGYDPGFTHSAIHTDALNHTLGNNPFGTMDVPTSLTAFHVYALEWTPTRITTFVDGEQNLVFNRNGASWERWPFDRPFHLILNVAVGGTWGGAQGVDPNDYPTRMLVDYVRVYEDASGPPVVSFTDLEGPLHLEPGADLSLEATATDPVSEITGLSINQGDAALATSQTMTASVSVENLFPGCYEVRAVATDDDGWTGSTEIIPVTVGDTCGQAPYLMRAHRIPGRIQAEYYDIGGSGIAYADLSSSNTGGSIRRNEGVDIGPSLDIGGGYRIEDVTIREWVEYTAHVEQSGYYRMIGRVTATKDGSFRVSVNGDEMPEPFTYASTNSESFYRNATLDGIWLEQGPVVIRLSFSGAGTLLNWFEFQLMSGTAVESGNDMPGEFAIEDVFPQPFSQQVTIRLTSTSGRDINVRIFDMLGRMVWSDRFAGIVGGSATLVVRPGLLPAGVYVVRVSEGPRSAQRVVTIIRP